MLEAVAELNPQLRPYVERAISSPPAWDVPVELLRAGMEAELPEIWGAPDEVDEVVDLLIPGPAGPLRVRVYRPRSTTLLPVLVWFHGGGWVVGSLDSHDPVCRAIANRAPCVVVAVDYRLAPEHPYPAAVEDAWAATEWVAEEALSLGADVTKMVVGGDSAGGNLAAVVALRARDAGLPLAMQALVYPVTDFDLASESYNGSRPGSTSRGPRWSGTGRPTSATRTGRTPMPRRCARPISRVSRPRSSRRPSTIRSCPRARPTPTG